MADITELAQREKFEAWLSEKPLHARYVHWCGSLKAYDYASIQLAWQAYQAGGAELVEALEKAQQYAKERDEENQDLMLTIGRLRVEREGLEAIRAAAEKLVRCKGRYHSEHNYRALAALFGVKTPDLPPLDSESSAVTVKLTDINEFLAEVHDKTLNRAFRLLAEGVRAGDVAAMRAAGIKVETE